MAVRLLFLDRDGTLNRTLGNRPPNDPRQVTLLPNVTPTLATYVANGWQLVIVTNQGGVARGYLTETQAHAVLQRVIERLSVPIAASYLCPHMPGASSAQYNLDCPNRKPHPGFILQALQAYDARPDDCLFVGDSITDLEAAQAADVPFCWADRFFDRPIDRGMQTRDKEWIGLREEAGAISGGLRLLAFKRGEEVGWLTLSPQRTSGDDRVAALDLCVDEGHHRQDVGSLLLVAALEWARVQGLERLDLARAVAMET